MMRFEAPRQHNRRRNDDDRHGGGNNGQWGNDGGGGGGGGGGGDKYGVDGYDLASEISAAVAPAWTAATIVATLVK